MDESERLIPEQNSPPYKGGVPAGRGGCSGKTISNKKSLKPFRRQLRKNLTPAEARLWIMLRGKQLEGRKFRRQHSIGHYILDFYCPAEKLAIELDGQGHINPKHVAYDQQRDLFLQYHGIKVLRFENRIVFENPHGLLHEIKKHFGRTEI